MKNKIKKNIHRTLSVFMIVLLMLGVVPIVVVMRLKKCLILSTVFLMMVRLKLQDI